jgi:folylpolyglutamate synthase/dihydropteroate synthase
MLPPLAGTAGRIVLTRPESPRAQDPAALLAYLPDPAAGAVVEAPRTALAEALTRPPVLLVVAGSIYLVAELRREALARGGRARPAG